VYRICVYATAGDEAFEANIPLIRHAEFMRRFGIENKLHVHFMLGAERLSQAYHRALREHGYQVHDNSADMSLVLSRFPNIACLPTYFAYNYLRWPILELLVDRGDITLPLVGVDGDIAFTAPFDDITRDIAGKTFILEGNPCFTAISDMEWLRSYGRELERLDRDPAAFNLAAAQIKRSPARDDRRYCNASWYPVPIRHDQDLLQCLVAGGRLPQSEAREIFNSDFYWIQNPLFPGEWFSEQCGTSARAINESDGRIAIGWKRLAFVHYQNDFARYCHAWQRLDALGLQSLGPALRYSATTGIPTRAGRLLYACVRRLDREKQSRARTYEQSLIRNERTGNLFVTDMIGTLLRP
jgi:hypothetical protein